MTWFGKIIKCAVIFVYKTPYFSRFFCPNIMVCTIKIFLTTCLVGFVWLKVTGKGESCVAVRYLTPYFGYFILPPRCQVGEMPCPRKSQKNYTKEKTATDKRRRRFFYTFLYSLGSTTIPWIHWNGWIPQLKCQKYVNCFHVCMCPYLVFRASIRVSSFLGVCQSPVRVSL